MMTNHGMYERLLALEKPITVGIAGAGEFASQIVSQSARMQNMEVLWIADLKPEAGKQAFLQAGYPEEDIAFADSVPKAVRLTQAGKRVVLDDGLLLPLMPADVLCDVTGDPKFGAQYACNAIENGKHMVVVNIESDCGVGAALRRKADANKVVYTEADGDQPSLIKGMFDWARCLGLEVETLGKWTCLNSREGDSGPYNRVKEGFLDGSKNQVEMCCVANMTGFTPDVRGMHMPAVGLTDIPDVLCAKDHGGIFGGSQVVDVVNFFDAGGKNIDRHLHGGVFIIIRADHDILRNVIGAKEFIVSRDGRRALLYRPFHFVGIEAPMSVLRAVLYGEATASPLPVPAADVIAIAKRDLSVGDMLDGIGGQTVRGEIERRDTAEKDGLLPLILAQDIRLKAPVKRGEPLTYSMAEKPDNSFLWQLRQNQDAFKMQKKD
jgi:predicted homoserine dehydrogenase-like protein